MNKVKCIVCNKEYNLMYIANHHKTSKHINNLKKYKENKKNKKNNIHIYNNIYLIF